ncbi:unnamed protein product [Symbiodinium sp. CCMP2592]|nr:unnamed protein product [Symbiodinium sp. CCMP2592]
MLLAFEMLEKIWAVTLKDAPVFADWAPGLCGLSLRRHPAVVGGLMVPMAGLESVPAFTERAKQIGIGDELLEKFKTKNLDTYGKLAFICSSRPSSGDDKALFEAIRLLIGKSLTGETSPREMPLAERLTRLKRQRGELKGLEMDVHTEPGHALVDRVQAMLDSAQVLHIAPETCISRHDEILGDKTEQKLSLGADGNIKITKQASSLRCETTGELKLRRCFLRRALALDQVGLASYAVMESWHNKMFQSLLDAPPAGYRYTTVQQVLAADQKLWQVVAQESRGDISIGVGMPAPLDKHIIAAAKDQFVMSCLTHLPKPPEASVLPWKPRKGGKDGKGDKGDGKGGKGKGGKGKQNQTNSGAANGTSLKDLLESLPEGCVRATDEGRFICPFYIKGICRFQKRKSCRFGAAANDNSPHLSSGAVCKPEIYARRLLQQREPVTAAQLAALFDALPHDRCDRDESGFSFSAGLYSRVQVGLRKACKLFPLSVQAVNKFVTSLLSGTAYTSFAMFSRVQTREHRDTQNSFLPNVVIPLTAFNGGSIEVKDKLRLRRLGFPFPDEQQLASREVCPTEAVQLSQAQRAVLPSSVRAEPGCPSASSASDSTTAVKPPTMVECLASCGPVAAQALSSGWNAIPVGKRVPAVESSPMLCLDFSVEESTHALLNFDSSEVVDWWHGHLFLKSCKKPDRASSKEPLRTAESIFGCPGLSPRAKELVQRDNRICSAVVSILLRASDTGALVSLIGPARSWAWSLLAHTVKELAAEEESLRASMHADVASVTKGKAISLFRELLEETGFPDMSVVELLEKGAQSVLRREVLQRTKGLISESDYADMRSETAEEEVKAGFLAGPYTSEAQVSEILGTSAWSLSPRFLLRQGEDSKVRIIDDFKMSAVNRAFGSTSFLELQDTDFAVGLLRFLSRILQDRSRVRVPLMDGSVLEGDWAPEMLSCPPLLAKTLDLSKAYRQVAIHPSSKDFAVLGFPTPSGEWEFYLAKSLPFGAAASVFGFNKIALGVLHIMVVKFMAIATDFYDDYTIYEFKPAASLLDKALMRLLDILGWTYARSGRKFVPFAERVTSLGVTLGLEEIWGGILTVENKAGRLERIALHLKAIADGGEVTRTDIASLHGLINFAGGLILGFELKPTSRMLSRALSGPFRGNTPELRQACSLALDVISQCRPKRCPASVKPPIILYADGAYEKGVGTWGAILIDNHSGARWAFGGTVCHQLKNLWERQAGEQVICQVEAYALAIVLFGLRGFLKGRSLIAFIDNEACRFGFIKRYSPSSSLLRLISLTALLEGSLEALLWFERVPSKSNPADLPSRGAITEVCERFAVVNKGDIALTPTMLDFLCATSYDTRTAQAILSSTRLEGDWADEAVQ